MAKAKVTKKDIRMGGARMEDVTKNNDIFCTREMVKMTVYANKQVMGGVIARHL